MQTLNLVYHHKSDIKYKIQKFPDGKTKSEYFVQTECTPEEENQGLLQVIYENGKFYNQTTLAEVRERLLKQ